MTYGVLMLIELKAYHSGINTTPNCIFPVSHSLHQVIYKCTTLHLQFIVTAEIDKLIQPLMAIYLPAIPYETDNYCYY